MLGAEVAKTFDARLNRTKAERIVRMWLKCMTNDVGAIKLDAGAECRATELCRVSIVVECCGDGLHGRIIP